MAINRRRKHSREGTEGPYSTVRTVQQRRASGVKRRTRWSPPTRDQTRRVHAWCVHTRTYPCPCARKDDDLTRSRRLDSARVQRTHNFAPVAAFFQRATCELPSDCNVLNPLSAPTFSQNEKATALSRADVTVSENSVKGISNTPIF